VSFDPEHDTPAVLHKYAEGFTHTAGGAIFDRWEFAAAPRKELQQVADFFGLYISGESPVLVHSMSTTVISPDGAVYKWYDTSDWNPETLVADASASAQAKPSTDAASAQAQIVTPAPASAN